MSDEKPNRVRSTVVQQLSHGRGHNVQVEIIPSTSPKRRRKRSTWRGKKAIKAALQKLKKPDLAASPSPSNQPRSEKQRKKIMRKRSGLRPSFLSSTRAKSRWVGETASVSGPGKAANSPVSGSLAKQPGPATVQRDARKGNGVPPPAQPTKRKLRSGGHGFVGLSAGMPGNEEVDPPQRVSSSTPGQRYLDMFQSK